MVLPAVFAAAFLYATVGHGGASAYLAILALASVPPGEAATSALVLNVLVASLAAAAFRRAGLLDWKLAWPFLAGSIPMAYAGGLVRLPPAAFAALLAAALALAAARLWLDAPGGEPAPVVVPAAVGCGMAIGLVSGMIGIGGGVFLSPVLLLLGWADAKRAAAASAVFILANSLAALAARAPALAAGLPAVPLVLAAFAGGWLGARAGAGSLPEPALRRLLGLVLLAASLKLLRAAL